MAKGHQSLRILIPALTAVAVLVADQSAASAQSQKALTKVSYQETTRAVSYAASYVAISKGFFKDEGLDVDLHTAQGSDRVMAALLSGSADVGLTGPEFPLYIWHGRSPVKVKIVCGLVAADATFLLKRGKGVTFDWKDMKGKKVIGFLKGGTPTMFLEEALRKHGIDPKTDVEINSNLAVSARYGAFISGEADYAIFFDPEASRLQREGAATIVSTIGEVIGPIDFTVFSVTDDFIKKNPKTVQAWTNAIYRAQKWLFTSKREEIADVLTPFFPGVNRADILSSIDSHREKQLWKRGPLVEPDIIGKFEDVLIAGGALKPDQHVSYENVADRRFADEAVAKLGR